MATISVLMSNYNHAPYIGQAISSVLAQTYTDWELVIVDDCSTDASVGIIEKYLNDKRIRFFRNDRNIGTIGVLEKMINEACASLLAILDSDDALEATALDEVVNVSLSKTDIGLLYTQNWRCDKDLKPIETGYSALIADSESNLHRNTIHHFRVFKKADYLRTPGYDEATVFAEDLDLVLKLEEVTKVHFIDKPLYYYRILPKSQTHRFKNEMINRSSTALAKLNAYKRRQGTAIPNLDKNEIAEVLFFGIFTALLAARWRLAGKLISELAQVNPFFLLRPHFYSLALRKAKKIARQKINHNYGESVGKS